MFRSHRRLRIALDVGLLLVVVAGWVVASPVTVPNTFSNGTVADADQVNANFTALTTAINNLSAGVTSLQPALIVPVQANGADAAANGNALIAAMAGITDAAGTKPYMVTVGPGVYNLGSQSLTMKAHVDLRGSGTNMTRIQSTSAEGTIIGAANSTLRVMMVENSGGLGVYFNAVTQSVADTGIGKTMQGLIVAVTGADAVGIRISGGSQLFGLKDITVVNDSTGTGRIGIHITGSHPGILKDIEVSDLNGPMQGTGIHIQGATNEILIDGLSNPGSYPTTVDISGGGNRVRVVKSDFTTDAPNMSIVVHAGGNLLWLDSLLRSNGGGASTSGGTIFCQRVWNENINSDLPTNCNAGG